MDAKRLFLITALSCVSALAVAQPGAGRALRSTAPIDTSALPSSTRTISVMLDGAIERPGAVKLPASDASVQQALAAGGGVSRDSYQLGTLVLRRGGAASETPDCIPPMARHASLLIQDDPRLVKRANLVPQLLSGQMIRKDARNAVTDVPGTRPQLLQDGDLIAVPVRSAVVYVATAQGAIVRMQHDPAAAADAYIDQLSKADRKGAADFVLHYPNGQQQALALGAWHYRPTMVPPGSLLAPDRVCLRAE